MRAIPTNWAEADRPQHTRQSDILRVTFKAERPKVLREHAPRMPTLETLSDQTLLHSTVRQQVVPNVARRVVPTCNPEPTASASVVVGREQRARRRRTQANNTYTHQRIHMNVRLPFWRRWREHEPADTATFIRIPGSQRNLKSACTL